jgi:hypothetical protein
MRLFVKDNMTLTDWSKSAAIGRYGREAKGIARRKSRV